MPGEKYAKEELAPDYQHEFHAGNIGEVWKHLALLAALTELIKRPEPLTVLDCHAGSGAYQLNQTGEWQEGIGRLISLDSAALPPSLAAYLDLVKGGGFDGRSRRSYPGSPKIVLSNLRSQDHLICCETNPETFAALGRSLGEDPRLGLHQRDGLAVMLEWVAAAGQNSAGLILIDPPWRAKQDWRLVPEALTQAWEISRAHSIMLWYPIKSYTRVTAMQKQLQSARVPFVCLDLITTPLEHQRNRLNGSGILWLNPLPEVLSELSRAAAVIARHCSVFPGNWEFKLLSRC